MQQCCRSTCRWHAGRGQLCLCNSATLRSDNTITVARSSHTLPPAQGACMPRHAGARVLRGCGSHMQPDKALPPSCAAVLQVLSLAKVLRACLGMPVLQPQSPLQARCAHLCVGQRSVLVGRDPLAERVQPVAGQQLLVQQPVRHELLHLTHQPQLLDGRLACRRGGQWGAASKGVAVRAGTSLRSASSSGTHP